ncbi:xin actin-binding repeat-containing protein 1 isoform 2-T2 [Menidia menidia]
MSALYLSKVANQESKQALSKPEQDRPSETGKKAKLTKMAEDSQQRKDDVHQLPKETCPPGTEDIHGAHSQQLVPSQLSKENLYQQRQKCELRRLLKHTHPELRMLEDAVDEEFAEILSSESATAGETGYEGEVLSRCLLFENPGLSNNVPPCTPKIHMAGAVKRQDFSETAPGFDGPVDGPCTESAKGFVEDEKSAQFGPDLNRECEDEVVRIDVQATRRMFESQSRPNPEKPLQKVCNSGDDAKAVRLLYKQSETSSRDNQHIIYRGSSANLEEKPQLSCSHVAGQRTKNDCSGGEEVPPEETPFNYEATSFSDSVSCGEAIKTSTALIKNNPFISTNIEREHSIGNITKTQVCEAGVTANVKTRTHLFESMPFDKIRHQNKDDIETMVENIKETLDFLYHAKQIHLTGAIIEVNETMIAKKAKFTVSETGPQIDCDEVAEGGAQNFILQMLPRVNLKPQIRYLKENSKGCLVATIVDVPVHQHQFKTGKDTKTANVMQLVEDILTQDNSLRKGVIIQEDVSNYTEVMVYSLFRYFDEKDVKSYSPLRGEEYGKPEPESGGTETTRGPPNTSQDQTVPGSVRPEVKGNVKLFKSCIEKGDLEYLKTLQAEPTVQEQESLTTTGEDKDLHDEQREEESSMEWTPVDVKRLKSLFSGDQENFIPSAPISLGKRQPSTEFGTEASRQHQVKNTFEETTGREQEVCKVKVVPHHESTVNNRMHQADLTEVTNDADEISDLQTAIHSLQQATVEAKSFCHVIRETNKAPTQESSENHSVPVMSDYVTDSRTELPQQNVNRMVVSCAGLGMNELYSSSEKPKEFDQHHINNKPSNEDHTSENVKTVGSCQENSDYAQKQQNPAAKLSAHGSAITPTQEEEEEVVFQGTIKAAMESLEKSNINVTRGDFRAAMIYRNSNKPHQERSQSLASAQSLQSDELQPVTEPESIQGGTSAKSEPPPQTDKPDKRPVGPKPAIPPKPEHLKMKHRKKGTSKPTRRNATVDNKNPEAAQNDAVQSKEKAPQLSQPLPKVSNSCRDECEQAVLKSTNQSGNFQRNEPTGEVVQMRQGTEARHEIQTTPVTSKSQQTDESTVNGKQEINGILREQSPEKEPASMNETDESPLDFQEAFQKFGGKKTAVKRTAPVKPKRVKMVHTDGKSPKSFGDATALTHSNPPAELNVAESSSDEKGRDVKQGGKVEMRERRGQTETEFERRQRLSVHMDEIMRGNMTTAMEIFDNLRKQEQLQSILSRVEEIEQDTSEVDVKSLRRVFETVPDWVVVSKEKQKSLGVENTKEKMGQLPADRTQSKTSMAHVYGDLERASEEIMNLKEQTLARLLDIEEAIRKALFSVSTLKSDADIVGLSCLFKESLGAVQGPSSSANISKISIGSSRIKTQEGLGSSTSQGEKITEVSSSKQRPSPPSSPAFISIQSAARKRDEAGVAPPEPTMCPACRRSPKPEEKFRTTKTVTCNSPAQKRKTVPTKKGKRQCNHSPPSSNREVTVLQVQTDSEGNSIAGTITENYERADNFGNRFHSSKTSNVVDILPETPTTSQAGISQANYQVAPHPEVQLPLNQTNTPRT